MNISVACDASGILVAEGSVSDSATACLSEILHSAGAMCNGHVHALGRHYEEGHSCTCGR